MNKFSRPTTSQKIIQTTKKLGLGGIAQQQGAAVNIFDTVLITTNTNRQTLTFFKNVSTKSRNFSNWQQGEFKAGETLAAEFLSIQLLTLTNTNLADDANAITAVTQVGQDLQSRIVSLGMCQLKIANDTVFKDFQLSEAQPELNPSASGMSGLVAGASLQVVGRTIIKLPTMPVIPPNQGIELTIDLPPITITGTRAVMVTLGRQGSIFASKTTL